MSKQCRSEGALHRRQLLTDGLLNLMRSRSYPSITVKDICEESAIPRRTFYHYFESKDDVLHALIENTMLSGFLAAMFEFDSGCEAMRQSFIRFFRFFDEKNREILTILLNNGHESRLVAYTSRWALAEKISIPQHHGLSDKLSHIAQIIGSAGFFSLLFHWCRNGYQETPEEMAEYLVWFLTKPLYQPQDTE